MRKSDPNANLQTCYTQFITTSFIAWLIAMNQHLVPYLTLEIGSANSRIPYRKKKLEKHTSY